MKKLLNFSTAFLLFFLVLSSCSEENLNEVTPEVQLKSYESGTHDGYFWQLWTDDASGWVDYQNGADGNYSVSWDYDGNFTCGKGWSSGSANRVVGYNCGVHNHSGGGVLAYYGWTRNPLIEYYVNERWGSNRPSGGTHLGTVSSDGGTYDIYTAMRYNAPSIDGTQTFRQIYSTRRGERSTGQNHTITFANHANAWANAGYGLGSSWAYAIMLTEAYGGNSSGNVNVTVWDNGSSNGDNGNDGDDGNYSELPFRLRARGTSGGEQVRLIVGGNTIETWTLGTSMGDYTASAWSSRGDIRVEFINDGSGRDVQIDYLSVDGDWRQAENQSYNTGVWQDGSCGGSNSEWLHCNGSIGFGDTP